MTDEDTRPPDDDAPQNVDEADDTGHPLDEPDLPDEDDAEWVDAVTDDDVDADAVEDDE